MCLKLVAPEYMHKRWNKYEDFLVFLERRGVSKVLFAYKDNRFGCLSRAAAVLLYNYGHLSDFLKQHPFVNNRLAGLVREILELPYFKAVLVVFASFGVYLVEMKEFYVELHAGLGTPISEEFTYSQDLLRLSSNMRVTEI